MPPDTRRPSRNLGEGTKDDTRNACAPIRQSKSTFVILPPRPDLLKHANSRPPWFLAKNNTLDPRRSIGEAELLTLAGKSLPLPFSLATSLRTLSVASPQSFMT
jgi:hypothetical protein